MKRGAVVMMDILGFKGIMKRTGLSAEVIAQAVGRLREAAKSEAKAREASFESKAGKRVEVEVATLSDTVVVAASIVDDSIDERHGTIGTIYSAGVVAAAVTQWAAFGTPPFSLRGVMTYGEFLLQEWIIVGPAIDEAATLEREAEGAIVWLAPSCVDALAGTGVQPFKLGLMKCSVPMKGGGALETSAVNPFHLVDHLNQVERDKVHDGILRGFDGNGDLSVRMKRQNTSAFLKDALEARLKG